LKEAIVDSSPHVIIKLEGHVPHIGLNLLGTWGLKVDPFLGLVKCDSAGQQEQDYSEVIVEPTK
jgi:hypothetical protein